MDSHDNHRTPTAPRRVGLVSGRRRVSRRGTTVIAHYPRGNAGLADQLRRASLSIPLNIAEGYGKRSAAERCHHYDIARGSAHECGAVFDASKILRLLDDESFGHGKTLLVRIVSMLVKMTQ
jgi:four helix bundle protein